MNNQYVNPFNPQTGMSPMGNVNPMGPGPGYQGAWQPDNPPYTQQNPQAGQRQNWKVYSPAPPVPPLIGRWVNSFDEIKPQDVPMDGSICFFPQIDNSCIYAMVWDNNGRITPYRFIPEKNDSPAPSQSATSINIENAFGGFANSVNARLDTFEQRMGEVLASIANQNSQPRNKGSRKVDKEEEVS